MYCTVHYINISVILSSEMSFLTQKTLETIYNMPVVNGFLKNLFYCKFWYGTVQYCTLHKHKGYFDSKNGFLDPKNRENDI